MKPSDSLVLKDFDEIFRYIGEAGVFQILIYILLGLPSYFSGYQNIAMTFLAPDVEHWCEVEDLTGFPYEQQRYVGETDITCTRTCTSTVCVCYCIY